MSSVAFSKAPFAPFGEKPFEIGGVKNFSLFEGESPSSRNSAAGYKRPRKAQGAQKNGNRRNLLNGFLNNNDAN